jgi:DNA replication protein DnaC
MLDGQPKDQAETSVLFELISIRYERRSVLITANQPFGEWATNSRCSEAIGKDRRGTAFGQKHQKNRCTGLELVRNDVR